MLIDCAACPARNRACRDCMMQVLFSPSTRDFGPDGQFAGDDRELLAALDVFADTAMVTRAQAVAARRDIVAGQPHLNGGWPEHLRAV